MFNRIQNRLANEYEADMDHWRNNGRIETEKDVEGCLTVIISLWAIFDSFIGASKIALGVWILMYVQGTDNIASVLIGLG